MKRIVLISLICLTFGSTGFAQSLEIGGFAGTAYYNGELNPGMPFDNPDFAYGFIARYNQTNRWTFRFNIYHGKVKASDAGGDYKPERMLKFESPVTEVAAIAELNFLPYNTGSFRNYFSPYIFGGIAAFFFNPTADGVGLRDLGTEGQNVGFENRDVYSLTGLAIPFGIGFKYSLGKRLGFAFEWGMRKTFTDYLDDVSTTYYLVGSGINEANTAHYLSDPAMKHEPGMERGNPKNDDWYSFAGVTLTYKFNLNFMKKCVDQRQRSTYY